MEPILHRPSRRPLFSWPPRVRSCQKISGYRRSTYYLQPNTIRKIFTLRSMSIAAIFIRQSHIILCGLYSVAYSHEPLKSSSRFVFRFRSDPRYDVRWAMALRETKQKLLCRRTNSCYPNQPVCSNMNELQCKPRFILRRFRPLCFSKACKGTNNCTLSNLSLLSGR